MKNELNKNSFAQGTIEYLVVIAVVVVLSLVVVALVINVSSSPSQQISSSSDKLGNVAVGGISIVEAVSDLDGDSLIMLSNNSSEGITLKKITIGENDNNYDDYISGVDSVPISLSGLASSCPCTSGQKSVKCEFVFEYLTKSGLTQIERRTINVQCTNSNENPTSPSTRLITPTNSCGAIASLEGYTPIDECSDVSGAGNYLFTQNMTCDITITANDVNIHGNNCTLTGNINGTSLSCGDGCDFNVVSLTANSVISNGSTSLEEFAIGGSGGTINLIDSNVNSVISNGAYGYGAGSGGIVVLLNSRVDEINVNGADTSADSGLGNGGIVNAFNSIIGTINANVFNEPQPQIEGVSGYGGTISLTDSTITSINAIGWENRGGSVTLSNVLGINSINVRGLGYNGIGGNIVFDPPDCPSNINTQDLFNENINYSGGSHDLIGSIEGYNCEWY